MAGLLETQRHKGPKLPLAIELAQRFVDGNSPLGNRSTLPARVHIDRRRLGSFDARTKGGFLDAVEAIRMNHINSHQWSAAERHPKPGETSTANARLEQLETYASFGVLKIEKCEEVALGSFLSSIHRTTVYVHPSEEAKFKALAQKAWANCVRKTGPNSLQAGS